MSIEIERFLQASGHPGELEVPLRGRVVVPEVVTVIPVAAHQENLEVLLPVFRKQSLPANKWQAYLYLNAPSIELHNPRLEANVEFLNRYQTSHPSSPFSWGLRLYDDKASGDDFSMGKVRQEAWWYALNDLLASGVSDEAIGFSHDADMVLISPHYFEAADTIGRLTAAELVTSDVFWSLPAPNTQSRTPALNRLFGYMAVSETAFRQATRLQSIWDAAIGFKLKAYISSGGYQAAARHTETLPIINNIKQQKPVKLFERLTGQYIVTSGRRYVERAARGESPFSAVDPAISPEQRHDTNAVMLQHAETNTAANLTAWCSQADTNNLRLIESLFVKMDGDKVELRQQYYKRLRNFGRQLMNASATAFNDASALATKRTMLIVSKMDQAVQSGSYYDILIPGSRADKR